MIKYKACDPIHTINKIRNKLYELDIILKEKHYENNKFFHSCKVTICNNNLEHLGISTNGKGLTLPYSIASAHAEFMERLQNNLLFENNKLYATKDFINTLDPSLYFSEYITRNNLILDFNYDPNEKIISVNESVSNLPAFYKNIFPFINSDNELIDFIKNDLSFDKLISVPFYSLSEKKEVFLPMELCLAACGSNGMAAGNTKHEALIQGFCEIFERYAGRRIYFERIALPDIPFDYFKDTIIYEKLINLISEKKYQIKIKDCSLGLGLPVIGILVIDEENRKYNFHLGSSLSPIIALERCLTEIHQNPQGIYWNDIHFTNLSHHSIDPDEYVFLNGDQIFVDGTGLWPQEIFFSTPKYSFNGLNLNLNKSDEEDMDFIVKKINSLGFDIFLRDVSYLGFPSYYIIVPGMSEFPIKKEHYLYLGDSVSSIKQLKNLKKLSYDELLNICNELNNKYYSLKAVKFKYQSIMLYHTNDDIHNLDFELLLFMLNYYTGNSDKSLFYISIFLKNKDFYSYKYYFGLKDYILLHKQNLSPEQISQALFLIYNNEAFEIIEDMKDPSKIFDHYEWPACFNCENCEIFNDCKYFDALKLVKKLQQLQKSNTIDHSTFTL